MPKPRLGPRCSKSIRLDGCEPAAVIRRIRAGEGACAVIREPGGDAVSHPLVADGFKGIVAAPERHGAAHGFQVVAAAARGARINQHIRMPPMQFVPVGEVAGDVLDFSNALAVRRVILPPERRAGPC